MRQLHHLLPAAGLTCAWLMPLHLLPWVSWHSEVPVFLTVLLTAGWGVAALGFREGVGVRVPMPPIALAMLGLGVVVLLQAATGLIRFFGDAWAVVLYLMLCTSAFLLGHQRARDCMKAEESLEALSWTLVLAGAGCTVIALFQSLNLPTSSEWITSATTYRRTGSNLAQPNQMATLVLMALVSLVYLRERARLGSCAAAMLATLFALGLATTESRTALLSLAALVLWWYLKGFRSRIRPASVGAIVALVLICYVIWPPVVEAFYLNQSSDLAKVNTRAGFRLVVWPQLLEAALQKPWLGWGARQTSVALSNVVGAYPVSEPYTYAHNILLELVLGFGIPFTAVLLIAVVVWARRRWHARAHADGWYCMALWVPLLVHALLEFPYTYAYLLAPATFALGILEPRGGSGQSRGAPVALLGAAMACTLVLAFWSALEYVQIEEDFRVARFESGRIGSTAKDYVRPNVHLLTQLGGMVQVARMVPEPGMPPAQIELAGEIAARFPWSALQNRYALALALNGRSQDSERELRVIRAMHGESITRRLLEYWDELAKEKYPQLASLLQQLRDSMHLPQS